MPAVIGASDDGAFILLAAAKLGAPLREHAQGWSEAKMEGDVPGRPVRLAESGDGLSSQPNSAKRRNHLGGE
jgi:hypothetical protein